MKHNKFKQTEIGFIPEDWKIKDLGNVSDILTGFPFKGKDYSNNGIKVLRGENVSTGFIRWDTEKRWNFNFSKMDKYSLKENDVVIGMDGSRVGRNRAIISKIELPLLLAQRVARLRSKEKLNQNYLFYSILSLRFLSYIESIKTGTSIPHISQKQISEFKIPIPPIQEQSVIGKIFSDLDSKIELLQKQNETLEKIGQAIFKQWFVDFEFPNEEGKPYKSSGGKMVESELGEIPKGWNVGKLGDFVDSVSGCSYTSKGLEESNKALVTLKSISVNGFTQEGFKEYTGDYKDKHVVKDGDIVVAHTDLTQNRIILGKPAVVRDLGKYEVMIASMDLSIVKPLKLLNRPYLFYLLSTNMFYGHAQGYANGTTVIHLSRKAIPEFPFIIPSKKVLTHFKEFSNHLFDKISVNQKGIKSLEKTRDLLLPKLMTGKIRVPLEVEE